MPTTLRGVCHFIGRPAFVFFTAVSALTLGAAVPAQAAVYAYAQQQTSNYTITGGALGTLSANTSSSAAQNALPSGFDSQVGTTDALESYVGPGGGKPAENSFSPKGQTTPDYSRGDALVGLVPGINTNNVAELYLSALGNATGAGSWSVSAPFTMVTTDPVRLIFDFSNQLTVINTGPLPATVQANYSYSFNIQNSSGAVVFSTAPTEVNRAISLTAPGSVNLTGLNDVELQTTPLLPGAYTIIIAGTENVFANVTPEPASLLLLATGAIGLLRRSRR